MGPKPYLSNEEEKELVEFLVECSKIGYEKIRQEVMKLIEEIVERKGIKLPSGKLSNGWWVRFLQSWPELSLHKGDPFAIVRNDATSYSVFKEYFDLLELILTKKGVEI